LNTLNVKEKPPNFENSFIYENGKKKTPDTANNYEIKKKKNKKKKEKKKTPDTAYHYEIKKKTLPNKQREFQIEKKEITRE